MILRLAGPVPSKKNLYRRGKNGTLFLDREVRHQIDNLVLQAQAQWGARGPIEHPDLRILLRVTAARADRDNKLTCLMDVLQDAGILRNDNIARSNGTITLLPAIVGPVEATEIEIIHRQERLELE
jgi:Holliday junction resolvase RusA-like endonuclease